MLYLLFASVLFTLSSCEEFLEEDISDREVTLLSPGDQAEIPTYTLTFLWEPMEDALEYRLQVVTPDFTSVSLYQADTVVNTNKFTLSLAPGEYQWRVRGLNGSSESKYSTQSFVIYESDLSKQVVVQAAPADQLLTASTTLTFRWQNLYGVGTYRLQVTTNDFQEEDQLLYNELVNNTSTNFTIPEEDQYQWRVRAETDTSQSLWSAVRTFTYDKTPPAAPVLTTPANNASVARPVTLRWEAVSDAEKYQLYVYKSDSVTLYNQSYPLNLSGTSHSFTEGTLGERLIWRLKASDKAGNVSAFSGYRSFVISK